MSLSETAIMNGNYNDKRVATPNDHGTIFLSSVGTNREVAKRFRDGLTEAGASLWPDGGQHHGGDNWIDALQNALSQCSAYAVLMGGGDIQHWVKAELSIAVKRHLDSDGRFPIFPLLLPGVEIEDLLPFLGIFQAERLAVDPSQADYKRLAIWLFQSQAVFAPATASDICPFPGLEAYDEETARFYFGRQTETLEALSLLGRSRDGTYRRWLQLEGPSGVGKSSLVKAGIIPAIRRGWIEARGERAARDWRIAIMRPGSSPIDSLASALGSALGMAGDSPWLAGLVRELKTDPNALRYLLRERMPDSARFLLVVDQFEEVFTLIEDAGRPEREHFDALLASALEDGEGPFHLVTTVRSDFTLRFGELPRLESLLNGRAERYYLRCIDHQGLRDVVRTPVRLMGLVWDEPTLADRILAGAADEPSPLLLVSNLLRLLWQRRVGSRLCASVFEELGGVGGALARRADALLESLGPDTRKHACKLLLQLVRSRPDEKPTRQSITLEKALEAAGAGSNAELILTRLYGGADPETPREFQGPRLIVISQADNANAAQAHLADRIDLAHEALLDHWDTLRDLVKQNREFREAEEGPQTAAQRLEKDASASFPSNPGQSHYRPVEVPSRTGDAYLKAVNGEVARRRWRRTITWSLVALAVLVLGSPGVGYWLISEQTRGFNLSGWDKLQVMMMRLGVFDSPVLDPKMVNIEGGCFQMGSPQSEMGRRPDEVQHKVCVDAFSIGQYEVTFEEYERFATMTGRALADDGWGRGNRPVINVSWFDAGDYARWLSVLTGDNYRLPTEAEWEYAARAGTETSYWWGDKVDQDGRVWANCRGCGSEWDGKSTAPVGSFEPNSWGLYDTAGNVWEWTCSPYDEAYGGAEMECLETNRHPENVRRVFRGGSWNNDPAWLRSAPRTNWAPAASSNLIGFRLAQDF